MAAAGGWEEIEAVAVGCGPGTYTGLRVGIATARALGFSRGVPVRGVCSLDALGRALAERPGSAPRLAALDARRGEVFSALYTADAERRWGPIVSSPEELAERIAGLEASPQAAGSGAVRFRQQLTNRGVEVPEDGDAVHRIAARHICALAANGADAGDDPAAPIYLRPPDAERWRERDSVQKAG